jgi:hypothetical protein
VSATTLPGSSIVSEPSLALDSQGDIFVTAPSSLSHSVNHGPSTSSSPLWKSSDGGATWQGPISTETGGRAATGLGGGDSDIVIDKHDNIYVTSLWLGDTSMTVSTDHGSTFTELPIGHLTPVDDRPWLAYDPVNDALWMDYDGGEALRVAKALLNSTADGTAAGPHSGLVFAQNFPAVPNESDRGCAICAPGTIAVDPSGDVFAAFAGPGGVGIAESQAGTGIGLSWTTSFVPNTAPGANGTNSDDFQVLRSDTQGNLYVVWSADNGSGPQVFLSCLQRGQTTWAAPIRISTSGDALFGTMAVVSPGIVDVAYYGSSYRGDPNAANSARWDVYLAQAQNLFSSPTIATAAVLPAAHDGSIDTQGISGNADRSLGDFFSIAVDASGMADIITVAGSSSKGTNLEFVHQSGPIQAGGGSSQPTPAPAWILSPGSSTTTHATYPPDATSPAQPPQPANGSQAAYGGAGGSQPGQAAHSSGKYPNGVPLAAMRSPASGGPLPQPPIWIYVLGVGGVLGRLILRRMRG